MNKNINDLMNMTDDEVATQVDDNRSGVSSGSASGGSGGSGGSGASQASQEALREEEEDQGTEDQNQDEGSEGASEGSEGTSTDGDDDAGDADDDDDKDDNEDDNTEGDTGAAANPLAGKSESKGKADSKPKSPEGEKEKKGEAADKVTDKTGNKAAEPDYKALYEQVMKPFKANGREVVLQNVDEAIKLMQMGANYTKKMQALQPNLKILKMLENNQLLDEQRLSQFIDMTKGDKNAIAKFVKDTGVDPMDIDPDTAVDYKAGNHTVSDSEITFQTVVEEVISTDAGQDLIIQVNHQWDQTSKKAIYQEPELVRVLARQKADGVYDQIASEVEKQRMLGHPQIANLPFIHAYKVVGEALAQQGLLKLPNQGNNQKPAAELARAPAPKRNTVSNGAKAKAASPSGNTSRKAQQVFNPLAQSDEEFLKSMENRV